MKPDPDLGIAIASGIAPTMAAEFSDDLTISILFVESDLAESKSKFRKDLQGFKVNGKAIPAWDTKVGDLEQAGITFTGFILGRGKQDRVIVLDSLHPDFDREKVNKL